MGSQHKSSIILSYCWTSDIQAQFNMSCTAATTNQQFAQRCTSKQCVHVICRAKHNSCSLSKGDQQQAALAQYNLPQACRKWPNVEVSRRQHAEGAPLSERCNTQLHSLMGALKFTQGHFVHPLPMFHPVLYYPLCTASCWFRTIHALIMRLCQ